MEINGVRTKVAPKTIIGINGAQYGVQNGLGARDYDKWRMAWNGQLLAPPELGCVLYLPGYPGAGATLFDFSYNFSDSAIDTDEALDATETGVDCDADATTAIPVDSIIIVEAEWMKVTATGVSLTVIRGYHGTIAAIHATNQDIRVWVPSNGAITGAIWTRLPSGLLVPSFDGVNDHVIVSTTAALQIAVNLSIEFWFRLDNLAAYYVLLSNGVDTFWTVRYNSDSTKLQLYLQQSDDTLRYSVTTQVPVANNWYQFALTYDGSNQRAYLNGAADGAALAWTGTLKTTTNAIWLGERSDGFGDLPGNMALIRIYNVVLTADQIANHFNQERHLFGV